MITSAVSTYLTFLQLLLTTNPGYDVIIQEPRGQNRKWEGSTALQPTWRLMSLLPRRLCNTFSGQKLRTKDETKTHLGAATSTCMVPKEFAQNSPVSCCPSLEDQTPLSWRKTERIPCYPGLLSVYICHMIRLSVNISKRNVIWHF